jgi:hypothetical protein
MPREQFGGISEQSKASKHRWDDAQRLFDSQRWRGAMYLAGYSLECLIKAKLMAIYGTQNLLALEAELTRRGVKRRSEWFSHTNWSCCFAWRPIVSGFDTIPRYGVSL